MGCPSKSRSVQLRWCIASDCSVRNLATIWVVWHSSPFDWTQCDVGNIILDFSLWPGMRQAVWSEIGKFWFDWANDIWPVVVFPTKWLHCSLIRGLLESRYSCPIKSWNCTFRAPKLWGPAHHSFLRSALAPYSAVPLITSEASNFSYYSSGHFTVYLWGNITADCTKAWLRVAPYIGHQ